MALLAALAMVQAAAPAKPGEKMAFDSALKSFEGGWNERAQQEFAEFARQFPDSDLVAEAVLYQALASNKLHQYDTAIQLLKNHLARAGKKGDEYRFWLAQFSFERADYRTAADAFAEMLRQFPEAPRRLEASYREALARSKLGDSARAIELLRNPSGEFQKAAQARPQDRMAAEGTLLLAEILFGQKEYAAAEQALSSLQRNVDPELAWQKQRLLTRLQLASGKRELALSSVSNLVALAAASGQKDLQAETTALQGDIYELMGQLDAAIQAYTNNLAPGLPSERYRQALLKITELSLSQNQPRQAIHWLETFLEKRPKDSALKLVRLKLGELWLQEYYSTRQSTTSQTNREDAEASALLQKAQNQFEQLIADFPTSQWYGKAQLDRGWTLWEAGNLPEAQTAFREATVHLPLSENQAIARFKWADTQFVLKDPGAALTNYLQLVQDYENWPGLRTNLLDQALYQLVRTAIDTGDLARAEEAARLLLDWFPNTLFSDHSLLLFGQALNQTKDPARARAVFRDFLRRFPESKLAADVQLAIARTYVQEQNWDGALETFAGWLEHFPSHPARPQAEFDRAWALGQSGPAFETNALAAFTNFVAAFPSHPLVLQAEQWIADYYFGQEDFPRAEKHYQMVYQNTNWPPSSLAWQAQLSAGRAAMARRGYEEARDYFRKLVNTPLEPEAYFALGDSYLAQGKFSDAATAYGKIPLLFRTNSLVPLALGQAANAYLQMAVENPRNYDLAAESYQKVLDWPGGDVNTRSQAEIGLGLVLEKQARQKSGPEQASLKSRALDHYLNVVFGKTRLRDEEKLDQFWLKEAGLYAAGLAEELNQWGKAVHLYEQLLKALPALRPDLEKRLNRARTFADEEKNA